jgi:hypothetical protein
MMIYLKKTPQKTLSSDKHFWQSSGIVGVVWFLVREVAAVGGCEKASVHNLKVRVHFAKYVHSCELQLALGRGPSSSSVLLAVRFAIFYLVLQVDVFLAEWHMGSSCHIGTLGNRSRDEVG